MQGCQATGKSSKSQAGRARTVLRGTSCPQRRPVDQPPHPEGSHTTVVPFYPAPLLTSLVFLSTPPWPDTRDGRGEWVGVHAREILCCFVRRLPERRPT